MSFELVKCISIREDFPEQIKIGKKYWIDPASLWTDGDGDEWIKVYSSLDNKEKNFIAQMKLEHFQTIYPILHYCSLEGFVNTHTEFPLIYIIDWCKNNIPYHQLARKLLEYIKDKDLNTEENLLKDYVVNSIPFKEFEKAGNLDEYQKYLGYDLYCVEK